MNKSIHQNQTVSSELPKSLILVRDVFHKLLNSDITLQTWVLGLILYIDLFYKAGNLDILY
jgi:hypothetical protein